jgi:hypothetical protein
MDLASWIGVVGGLVNIALLLLGVKVSLTPPSDAHKRRYMWTFAALGLFGLGLQIGQQVAAQKAQAAVEVANRREQKGLSDQIKELRAGVTSVADQTRQPPVVNLPPPQDLRRAVLNVSETKVESDDSKHSVTIVVTLKNYGELLTAARMNASVLIDGKRPQELDDVVSGTGAFDYAPDQTRQLELLMPDETPSDYAALWTGKRTIEISADAIYEARPGEPMQYTYKGRLHGPSRTLELVESLTTKIKP